MQAFEMAYAGMIQDILGKGAVKETRNGNTKSLFGMSLEVDGLDRLFPIIQGRQMYPAGVLGELAAMLRKPTCVKDFEDWGCNYWKLWGKEDGSINVDYGNAWFDFEGVDQIAQLKESLRNNPNDRRMIISGWRPHKIPELDLPCCHYSYQFYVANGKLSMIWTQRSVDMMVGLPSDIVFAAAWLIAIANEFNLTPDKIKFDLGDCHVYEEHYDNAYEYIFAVRTHPHMLAPTYEHKVARGKDFCAFEPQDIVINHYDTLPPLKFKLKA